MRGYGGEVELVDGSYEEAAAAAARALPERAGATLIHPYDDLDVIAGQGTVGLEIAEQAPATRLIVVAVGGGGLAAGVAIAAKSRLPGCRVVGVQAEGRVRGTICDGIAVKRPGEVTAAAARRTRRRARHRLRRRGRRGDRLAARALEARRRGRRRGGGGGAARGQGQGAGRGRDLRRPLGRQRRRDAARRVHPARGDGRGPAGSSSPTVVPDRPGALARPAGRRSPELGSNVIDVAHIREGFDLHVRETGRSAGVADRQARARRSCPRCGARAPASRPSPRTFTGERALRPARCGPPAASIIRGATPADPRSHVVHRPRYDDWSLPKGKLEGGEGFEDGALREVEEETGYALRARRGAPPSRYVDRKGRPKLVRWWLMEPVARRVRAERGGRRAAMAPAGEAIPLVELRARPRFELHRTNVQAAGRGSAPRLRLR